MITPEEAAVAVDQSTLVLLLAVMGMGAFLSIDGFFDAQRCASWRALARARLLAALVWGAGVLAASSPTMPCASRSRRSSSSWIKRWKLPRLPFLLALATASNTGSVATLVGNPQNMLCASLGSLASRPTWAHAARRLVALAVEPRHPVRSIFRRELERRAPERSPVAEAPDAFAAIGTLAVIAGTVVAYIGRRHP